MSAKNENCAFFSEHGCRATTKTDCENCRFCKNADQLNAGRAKARKRITNLAPATQSYISGKYYAGRGIAPADEE